MICATRIHNNESLTPYAPYDGTSVIEERSNSSLLAHYRYAGKLLALSTPQGNQYYHLDALGSTTELTDDQGDIKASYHLDPWGSIEEITGDSINRRIFTGKETDQNTGLINIGVRYYDPETARFITQDSYLGKQDEPPSLHRYLYAYSNPTVYVDLEGYAPVTSHVAKFLEGLSKDNKTELARMNARMNEKGLWGQLGSRTTAAFMGIGGSILDLAGGTAKLADIAADANIAASPLLRNTAIGKESRKRIADTTAAVVHTAKSAYKFAAATVEDPSGTAQVAKEKFGNCLEKTFIQGDLTYTADFSGKMFDVATALAPVRAAQMSKAARASEVVAATVASKGVDFARYGGEMQRAALLADVQQASSLTEKIGIVAKNRLQLLTETQNANLAANPQIARSVLSSAEYAVATEKPRLAKMQYGNAVERLVSREAARTPRIDHWIEHIGGPNNPDFIGKGRLTGMTFDITTEAARAAHMRRPYGPGLNIIPYQRPTDFGLFPN